MHEGRRRLLFFCALLVALWRLALQSKGVHLFHDRGEESFTKNEPRYVLCDDIVGLDRKARHRPSKQGEKKQCSGLRYIVASELENRDSECSDSNDLSYAVGDSGVVMI